jgi:hypothetical protein
MVERGAGTRSIPNFSTLSFVIYGNSRPVNYLDN